MEHLFGPVPSRRLGRSIGINNVTPKHCTYACIYCQLGRAVHVETDRREFYRPELLIGEAQQRIRDVYSRGETIDYLTIVPDGEPTLDLHLGELICGLQETGIPVAVITNGSLLGSPDVRRALLGAQWVSIKVDAASTAVWKKIDRPHKLLDHTRLLRGAELFAAEYTAREGTFLATETMLIGDMNTSEAELSSIARFVGSLQPDAAYLSIPTRPPAESFAIPAGEAALARAYHVFSEHTSRVEHLTGYEGDEFSATGVAIDDLMSITAVHPMRKEAVEALLQRDGSSFDVVQGLLEAQALLCTEYDGHTYYVRKFRDRQMGR